VGPTALSAGTLEEELVLKLASTGGKTSRLKSLPTTPSCIERRAGDDQIICRYAARLTLFQPTVGNGSVSRARAAAWRE
jgi:hypothetical protein